MLAHARAHSHLLLLDKSDGVCGHATEEARLDRTLFSPRRRRRRVKIKTCPRRLARPLLRLPGSISFLTSRSRGSEVARLALILPRAVAAQAVPAVHVAKVTAVAGAMVLEGGRQNQGLLAARARMLPRLCRQWRRSPISTLLCRARGVAGLGRCQARAAAKAGRCWRRALQPVVGHPSAVRHTADSAGEAGTP